MVFAFLRRSQKDGAPEENAHSRFAKLSLLAFSWVLSACSQTASPTPVRSMERPKDVTLLCLQQKDSVTWRGAPLSKCAIDALGLPVDKSTDQLGNALNPYRLHALVTQTARGEVAVVDLAASPSSTDYGIVKVDPKLPGYTFLPVSAVPTDVTADPGGKAFYVSSGRSARIDVIPSEFARGPISSFINENNLPWPHIDLDPVLDGVASQLLAVRPKGDEQDEGRLYALLPDAQGGSKIAVFDVSSTLVPKRLTDVRLSLNSNLIPKKNAASCGVLGKSAPWWKDVDACPQFAGKVEPSVEPPPVTSSAMRLSGMAIVNSVLVASDDLAPWIHVFDLSSGQEIHRLYVGNPSLRVAMSDVVPDEVTQRNGPAIMKCEEKGWMGDGLDHSPGGPLSSSQQSALVGKLLSGRCLAHRYIYVVDKSNEETGNGAIAILDIPTRFQTDGNGVIERDANGQIVKETLDFANASLVQPFGCDAPSMPQNRLALGSFSITGQKSIPVRDVMFVNNNPIDTTRSLKGLRCRPFDTHPDAEIASLMAQEPTEANRAAGEANWRTGVDPLRLRGSFAVASLASGSLGVIDVDDYDSLCRGARDGNDLSEDKRAFKRDSDPDVIAGPSATGEYLPHVVRRHHPRASGLFNVDNLPSVTNLTLSLQGTTLSFDSSTADGLSRPRFVSLRDGFGAKDPNQYIVPSADNPYTMNTEVWTVVYQGALPGFRNAAGAFETLPTGVELLRDSAGDFCNRGTEAEDDGSFASNDYVQIIDDVCRESVTSGDGGCTPDVRADCLRVFGDVNEGTTLPISRDMVIKKAYQDRVEIAQSYERQADGSLRVVPGVSAKIKSCFPGVTRYTVRARSEWVVAGSVSGYLHRQKASVSSDMTSACVTDKSKPIILRARAREVAPNTFLNSKPSLCERFVSPIWQWTIESGFDGKSAVPTVRDMTFAFSNTRFSFQGRTLGVGGLVANIKPISLALRGVEKLNWNSFIAIDSIDRGLVMFSFSDLTVPRQIN